MPRKPPRADSTTFEIELKIDAKCTTCGADRLETLDAEGRVTHRGERATYILTDTPCECGKRRVRVGIGVEAG